jgi:hypothetical protein
LTLNAPEAPVSEKAELTSAASADDDVDESKVGDEYDAYDAVQLRAIAKQYGINVKSLREKALRIRVRSAMSAMSKASPALLPVTPHAPPAPPTPHAPPASHTERTDGVFTQTMTEEFSQAPKIRRPRFTLLVDTTPAKTQSIAMTISEAFAVSFLRIAQEHGVTDWRLVPHGHGGALVYQAVAQQLREDSSLDGTVLLLRTGTPEGSLLFNLLFEHALEVYGA